MLSGELTTYLSGRYVEFIIYPFSFSEYAEFYSTHHPKTTIPDIFTEYLITGGMPYIGNLTFEAMSVQIYLRDLFNSVVLKDIVKRNGIRDIVMLEHIIAYMFSSIGMTFSATNLSKYLRNEHRNIAPETVINYVNHSLDAFLFYRIRRHDFSWEKTTLN